ncbi:MAG: flagellin [Alphaproteobacteria bacterium]|nr:flagellin [Alphaproteobacteria bacterium]
MSLSISNLSITKSLTSSLQSSQTKLSSLTEQLASGLKSADLTDYTPSECRTLINLQASLSERKTYVTIIDTSLTTLSLYDTTLSSLEEVTSQAQTLASNNQTYTTDTAENVLNQAELYLRTVRSDLNQSVNGRYLYSGSRYTTAPVADLISLPESTLTSTIYTDGSTLPAYDSGYTGVGSTSTEAYVTDTARINAGYDIDYGITSNEPAMQKLIAGLRYLQAAGNATDSATYADDISQAATLLTDAISALQELHTKVANNTNLMETEKESQKSALANLTNQIADIEQVDLTQVSTEITTMQSTLQASYTATGSILKLSLANYL